MRLSIKARITLWYAALLLILCAAALLSLFALADKAQIAHARDTLESATAVIMDEMEVEHGRMEIDADLDDIPNVYASLFDEDGRLIYGRRRVELPFEEGGMRRAQAGEHSWYVLDTRLAVPGSDPVWLRVHMSSELLRSAVQATAQAGLWLMPLLALIALGGGYVITRGALRPVKKMTQVAAAIADSGRLDERSALSGYESGHDELHALAVALDSMLKRLRCAFERERQFTADAAHELRTPLSAMRTQGEYALTLKSTEEKDEAIGRMLEKNEEMRLLVDQLLMIARLDAGQIQMEDGVALAPLLARVAEDMDIVAQERGIRVETVLEDVHVRGNPAMLTRAAVNLVDNAIRYGREGGSVRVTLAQEGTEAVIRVEDDGAGIAPEALAHVFERFWRGDCARSTAGTGIGLAIVQAAAQAHGGSAYAQSEVGRGSCFSIRLPQKGR